MKFFFVSTFLLTIASTPITAPEPPQNGAEGTVAGSKQSEAHKLEGYKPKVIETGVNLKEVKKPVDDVKTVQQADKHGGAEKTSLSTENNAGEGKVMPMLDRPQSVMDQLPGDLEKPENPQHLQKLGNDDNILHQEIEGFDKDRELKRQDGLSRKEDRYQPIGNPGQINEKPEQIGSAVVRNGGPQQIDGLLVKDGRQKQFDQLQGVERDSIQGSMSADKSRIGDKSQQVSSPGDSSSSSEDNVDKPQKASKPQWNEMKSKQDNTADEQSKIVKQDGKAHGVVQPDNKLPGKDTDSSTSDDQETPPTVKPVHSKDNKKQPQYNTAQINDYDNQNINKEKEDHQKLVQDFEKLSEDIKKLGKKLDRYDKLELHGLYKQATDGECTVDKPNRLHVRERAKWHAWKAKEGLSKDAAMQAYVTKARLLINRYGV